MIALEIGLNGVKRQTIAAGEHGWLSADVHWIRLPLKSSGTIREELRIIPCGMAAGSTERLRWPDIPLQVGDSVTITVIKLDGPCDPPDRVIPVGATSAM